MEVDWVNPVIQVKLGQINESAEALEGCKIIRSEINLFNIFRCGKGEKPVRELS